MPGARVTYHRREYEVEVVINDKGLRDVPRSYEAAPGTLRVLALGDSFVEGYSVPLEATVTQQLEKQLCRRGCVAEVINGGTTAYNTDQELLFFRTEGVRYRPDIVLLFVCYNDVWYNDPQGYFGLKKPIFQMTDQGLELHRYPVPRSTPRPAAPEAIEEQGSALVGWIGERLWYGAPRLYDALSVLGVWEPMPRMAPRLELRVYDVRQEPVIEQAWIKTEAILRAFRDDVAHSGARFLVVYVPSRMEVEDDSWKLAEWEYRGTRLDRGTVARRLKRIARRNGFRVLDLTGALRDADHGLLGRPYYRLDVHWTARGDSAAAGALNRHLAELGWLARCHPRRPER